MKIQPVSVNAVTRGPKHHFFGFHDLCPWDASGRYMLAMETDFIDRPPGADDKARICVIDTSDSNKLSVVAETAAWNFHQGARLQWLPNDPENIIYNDRNEDGKLISVVFNVRAKEKVRELEYPIYAISPNGDFGLGLDFERLGQYGGYGYALVGGKGLPIPRGSDDPFYVEKSTGIVRVELNTGKAEIILSTYEAAIFKNSRRENEHHTLTHFAFNPSGSRICFIDKFRLPDGGFLNRFITANPDGTDLYCVPVHASHFDWRNDTEILCYGKFSPKMTALRKAGIFKNPLLSPLLNVARKLRGSFKQKIAGQGYLLLTDRSQKVGRIATGVMTEDGHPQFSPDRKWVITDTYPDKNHKRTLILFDWENQKRIDLGKFKSLPEGLATDWDLSEMRTDLHPRWDRAGESVCFDSVHEGSKQMYVVDLSKIVNNQINEP
jgi:hypothetical protein